MGNVVSIYNVYCIWPTDENELKSPTKSEKSSDPRSVPAVMQCVVNIRTGNEIRHTKYTQALHRNNILMKTIGTLRSCEFNRRACID